MSGIAVRAEGLGKRYRIGTAAERHDSLRAALSAAAAAPFRNLARLRRAGSTGGPEGEDTVWALRDVSFEVGEGEVLGIVGRNGAGKSTLLKVLSRITEPTEGRARVSGRIGSLLEVGTGFHPELTGRENVYLNGSILGMGRGYIDRRFDEIVDFAGVERFIDTPVKRYSSGMYLRLAFAVAAHLEPEVLIVDEVLAVGDAEFQRKCLGKMGEVAGEGRTVLFVSHNMAAVRTLCSRALLLDGGELVADAGVEEVVDDYVTLGTTPGAEIVWDPAVAPQSPELRFVAARILDDQDRPASTLDSRDDFAISVEYEVLRPLQGLRIGFFMQNAEEVAVCGSNDPEAPLRPERAPGRYASRCVFPGATLNAGRYRVYFGADVRPYHSALVSTPYCLSFEIEDVEGHGPFSERLPGIVRPRLKWSQERTTP